MKHMINLFKNAGFAVQSTAGAVLVSLNRPMAFMEVHHVLDRAGISAEIVRLSANTVMVTA